MQVEIQSTVLLDIRTQRIKVALEHVCTYVNVMYIGLECCIVTDWKCKDELMCSSCHVYTPVSMVS